VQHIAAGDGFPGQGLVGSGVDGDAARADAQLLSGSQGVLRLGLVGVQGIAADGQILQARRCQRLQPEQGILPCAGRSPSSKRLRIWPAVKVPRARGLPKRKQWAQLWVHW
jgi:hypothetical protein